MATPTKYEVFFAAAARKDLKRLGPSVAEAVLRQIRKKLPFEPDKIGEPLHDDLVGYRKLPVGQIRVVYKVVEDRVWVLVLAVGKRAEGDFENIWDWLSKDKTERRLKQLIDEIDGPEEVAAE